MEANIINMSVSDPGDLQVHLTLCFPQSAPSNRGAVVKASMAAKMITKAKFHLVMELLRQLHGGIKLRLKERCLGQRE